jgi:pimeloyl-ACP methyl ester carboxylesterase
MRVFFFPLCRTPLENHSSRNLTALPITVVPFASPAYDVCKEEVIMKKLLSMLVLAGAVLGVSSTNAVAASADVSPKAFTVQVSGHGQPMILIPGLATSAAVWDGTVAHYAAHYQCHVVNLAGFAGVAPIEGPLLQQAEDALSQYIRSHHLNHPVIVGHSLGGFLAMKLAVDHGDQIGKLILVDSLPALGATQMPDATPEQLKMVAAQVRSNMEKSDATNKEAGIRSTIQTMVTAPADVDRIVEWGKESDRHTVIEAMYDLMSSDLRPQLKQVKAQTLVMGTWIAYKDYVPRQAVEVTFQQQYAQLSGVKIEMADKARHFIMYDDPQWMFEEMDRFLQ